MGNIKLRPCCIVTNLAIVKSNTSRAKFDITVKIERSRL